MSIQEYTLYKEYEGLSSEQQRLVREALFDVFGRDAMGRRNARAKESDPNFRKRVYGEQRLSYEAYDALVHNDYMEQGYGSARGEEMEEDFLPLPRRKARALSATCLLRLYKRQYGSMNIIGLIWMWMILKK